MFWQPDQLIQGRYQLLALKRDRPGHQVWLAFDQQAQTKVILKTLAFTGNIQWDEVKLFEREIEILQKLNHPRIPAFVDAFTQEQPYYCKCLVEQYIHAPSLQAFLDRNQTIPESQVWSIGEQILDVLRELHQRQPAVIHRDLKPGNILIDAQKQIYLVDLGAVGGQFERESLDSPTTVGSYGYTPAEQFMGQAVPASDLYALGATLMHLLTQRHPSELLNAQLRLVLPPDLVLSVPLKHWLYRLTAPQVSDRLPTAEIARNALAQARTDAQRLLKSPSDSRLTVSSDSGAIEVKPVWNEATMARKDRWLVVGISFLPLFFGGGSAILTFGHVNGIGLIGVELLIAMMSLLPTALLVPRLFWNFVNQSVVLAKGEVKTQWKIAGVQVRQQTMSLEDIATLRIESDRSQAWKIAQYQSSNASLPLIQRLPGADLGQFYRALEAWLR